MEDLELKCPSCCNQTFSSKSALIEHLASILNNVNCPICHNKWSSIGHLIEHLTIDNCQYDSSVASMNFDADPENVNDGQIAGSSKDLLHESNVESVIIKEVASKDLGSPFSTSINDVDGVSEVSQIYEEFLSKQVSKPHLQTQELKLMKDGGGSQYVLVLKQEDLQSNGTTVVTKQNEDGTISMTTVESIEMDSSEVGNTQESQEVEETQEEIYTCNSCGMSFTSVLDHIQNYHNNQDVVVEEAIEDVDTTESNANLELEDPLNNPSDEMTLKRMITDTGNIIEAPMSMKTVSITSAEKSGPEKVNDSEIKEEVIDKLGRSFTRRYIVVDKFKESFIKNSSKKEGEEEKLSPYHKVVIKEMESDNGEKLKVFNCISCNTYVTNLDEFKSRPCLQVKYQCQYCPVTYNSPKSLCAHMKVHKNRPEDVVPVQSSVYECTVCNTVFQTHKSLKLHKRMHDPVKSRFDMEQVDNFLCSICDKLIPMEYCKLHIESHDVKKVVYHCDVCNKLFQAAEHLEMHRSVHATDKVPERDDKPRPYKCLYCTRSFTRPHEKVKHERIHTGEKPHACEICGKSFRVAFCLTLHMRTHTGARPYACQQCGKRFKAYSVYSHHMLIHSDVRAYKCTFCPKTFKTPVQLAGHKKSHTKPFSCQHCNRPFASLYAVRVHTETHNQQNKLKFSCALCGASYARAFGLKDHFKSVHKKKDKFDELTIIAKDVDDPPQNSEENLAESPDINNMTHEVEIDLPINMANDIEVP